MVTQEEYDTIMMNSQISQQMGMQQQQAQQQAMFQEQERGLAEEQLDVKEVIRDILFQMLTKIGYEITTSSDGVEAIKLYIESKESGFPFDAVIMDLTIPGGMGGIETIKKLKEIDPNVKAIVSSGYSNDPAMSNLDEYGFKGVIAKPYRPQELREILQEVLEG